MVQPNPTPPAGPKGPRGARASKTSNPRLSTRAGIHKRRNGLVKVDQDGDLEMGVAGNGRGRGGRARGTNHERRSDAATVRGGQGALRGGIGSDAAQKAILRSMGAEAATIKGSRTGLNLSKIIREAASQGRGQDKREALHQISVTGWRGSKAASNPDGGVGDLLAFLERKAMAPDARAVRIIKSRTEGDALIVFVKPEDSSKILRLNTFMFAGAALAIEERVGSGKQTKSPPVSEASEAVLNTRQKMTAILNRRYDSELKLLNLSSLGKDPELVEMGMFATVTTESKFFPALMKVCDLIFASAQQKRDAVVSVTLADNMLSDIKSVTSLAQTFPDLKNLDLSNNQIKDLRSIEGWRWKFRHLDHLVLTGNPIDASLPTHKDDLLKWYPALRFLNGTQVRSDEAIAAVSKGRLPLPILPASFRDEASIGETFIKEFFPAFDADRSALAHGYYDAQSTFSLNINTSAPRASEQPPGHEKMKPLAWDAYIKKSRNLLKVTHLPARMSRAYVGTAAIRDAWLSLPPTLHPDLLAEPQKWLIECHSLPGLPDPTGQSPGGVGGLTITVHGEFYELDDKSCQPNMNRSFDRTFVIGPGSGIGGIRVVSDILTLRAWGGSAAWAPEPGDIGTSAQSPSPVTNPLNPQYQQPNQQNHHHQQQPELLVPADFGSPAPSKSEEQVLKETMVLQLSKATGMTLEYSAMCLEQSGWSLEDAAKAFESARMTLPADAFL